MAIFWVDLPIENGDFPIFSIVKVPEATNFQCFPSPESDRRGLGEQIRDDANAEETGLGDCPAA